MAQLAAGGWVEAIRREVLENSKPVFGICLGMQLMATLGTEGTETPGLDLIKGDVVRIDELGCRERIPHVGWNEVEAVGDHHLLDGIPDRTDFYFVHSYALRPADPAHVVARTCYGTDLTAAVGDRHIWGTQFHPEKSSKAGFRVLRNFVEFAGC
jgi:glutamine amidotransferase